MDPITQGALGASLSQSLSRKNNILLACLIGFLSGMAPDLDTLIRSETDPLLFLEYHRQFTHSLLFIPLGGLICASIFYLIFGKLSLLTFKQTYLFSTVGYATHGLLDTCTSYGTQLLWPISNHRFAWDIVSIIDPVLTLPLLICISLSVIKKQPKIAAIGLAWVVAYQFIGVYQNQRASDIGWQLAKQRGHSPIRLEAKPSFGNLILWKIIYETDNEFYIDGVRTGIEIKVFPGISIPKLNIKQDFPWLDNDSQQKKDLERFKWFSQGYVSVDPNNPIRIIDVRYSLMPNEAKGLWSIWLDPQATHTQHVEYRVDRQISSKKRQEFITMIFGE